ISRWRTAAADRAIDQWQSDMVNGFACRDSSPERSVSWQRTFLQYGGPRDRARRQPGEPVKMRHLFALSAVCLFGGVAVDAAWADTPTVSLTYPESGAIIDQALLSAIVLQAAVANSDEAVSAVTFAVCRIPCNSWILVDTARTPPYQARWRLPLP